MSQFKMPGVVDRFLLSVTFWRILPTPAILYLNRVRLRQPVEMPTLPPGDWTRSERRALLTGSEDRLRNLEGKGPGLATISAIVVAAFLVALTGGWDEGTAFTRVILGLAGVYAVLSLLMPFYLVGPLRRDTVHLVELKEAAVAEDPEEALAESAALAAMKNDLRNLRVGNHLDAARRELGYALALLLVWALLVPGTGLLRREATPNPGPDYCPSLRLAAGLGVAGTAIRCWVPDQSSTR